MQDTEFAITGTFNYEYAGDGVATGDDLVARVMLRFLVKVGTQYLQRDAQFTETTLDFQLGALDDGVLEYTSHVYSNPQWTATPEYYEVVSYVFNRNEGGEYNNADCY